jgi:hypothetical protein
VTKFLPKDGALCAETCRRDLINNIYIYIYVFKYVCAFSWYVRDIIAFSMYIFQRSLRMVNVLSTEHVAVLAEEGEC